MGEMRNAYKTSVGKREKQFNRPRRRWEDNIEVGSKVIECKCMN
jgi:hypothetical protein